jgi:hypothetical protein
VLPALQSAHTGLLQLEHPTESAIARRISEDEVNVDASHDALARGFDSGMTAAMSLTKDPDLRAQIARVHDLLLPDGVAASSRPGNSRNSIGSRPALRVPITFLRATSGPAPPTPLQA